MDRDIIQIMKMQRAFFDSGITKKYGFRIKALERLWDALEEYEEILKNALREDLNKSGTESYMCEIGLTKTELSYAIKHLGEWMKTKQVPTPISQFPAKSYVIPEPYGLTLIMAPWNYPVLLCLEPLIAGIAAGNCVVLKPSAYAPATSRALSRMLRGIYPQKYVAVVEGGREINTRLLEQKFDYIFFTGSVAVGKMVLEKAAQHLTPVTLELGGKSPCIVDETADIKVAAKRIIFGKLLNAGQTCVAPDYLLVHGDVKEKLLQCMSDEIKKMLGNHPLENPDYPKIINRKHFKRLLHLIERENVISGGGFNEETNQIEPTILDNITLRSPIMKEEIFGPILPVLTYRNREDLKNIILSFDKPLAFYFFTEKKEMEEWILQTFSFGGGCINDTIVHLASPYMPFGGVGKSGMGAYHGKTGFDTFSHKKGFIKNAYHFDIPLRYHPYTMIKDKLIKMFL